MPCSMLPSCATDVVHSVAHTCKLPRPRHQARLLHRSWLETRKPCIAVCSSLKTTGSLIRAPQAQFVSQHLRPCNHSSIAGHANLASEAWLQRKPLGPACIRCRSSRSCSAYRGDGQYGDFSITQYAPFQQALASPCSTDLNLDFDKIYLSGRRNMSVVPSTLQQSQHVQGVEAFLQYRSHLQEAGDNLDLFYCALLIARYIHPHLDPERVAAQLDSLAADVRRAHLQQPYDRGLSLSQTIGHVLYDVHGFHGDCDDFYDPDNNCLNVVLEERKGSPVALALLHLLVAERLGVWCQVVTMPSHCFLKIQQGPGSFLLDPFNKGQVCNAGVVEARLNANWGFSSPVIRVGPEMISSPRLATKRELLMRLLSNLRESYWGPSSVTGRIRWTGNMGSDESESEQLSGMIQQALVVTRFMRATGGSPPTLLRDEGYILSCLGRHQEASKLLQSYLQESPRAADKDRVQEFLLDSTDGSSPS